MTNAELISIFKANIDESLMAAIRGVYNAGYYEGAAITPTATSPDVSKTKAKPVAVVRVRHSD
jgi:hypothetical protein